MNLRPSHHAGLRIGLTGGIGSGKSTVARCWHTLGAVIIDTDAIARALTLQHGGALPAIAQHFGTDMIGPDGALDRDRMRSRVFADPKAKSELEAILHPMISAEAQHQAEAAWQQLPQACLVFDVPLLVESGHWRNKVDRVLVVDCLESTQMARVMARNGWTAEAVKSVMAQQASRSARRACADAVIWNDALAPEALQQHVTQLARLWGVPC